MWPALWFAVSLAIGGAVLSLGAALMRRGRRRGERHAFGESLLVGAIIGIALTPMQLATQLALRERARRDDDRAARAVERNQLLLQITSRKDLRSIDLAAADLRGLYLARKDFRGANLRGARLDHVTATRSRFEGADLSGASLRFADLRKARFRNAVLGNTSFRRADLTGADFSDSDGFRDVDEDVSSVEGEADFTEATMHGTTIRRSSFSATFARAQLLGADLRDSTFPSTNFRGAVLGRFNARNAAFCYSDFRGAAIYAGYAPRASFVWTNLRGAQLFANISFVDADFRGADLRGARVSDAGAAVHGQVGERFFAPTTGLYRARYDATTRGGDALARAGAWLYTDIEGYGNCGPMGATLLRRTPRPRPRPVRAPDPAPPPLPPTVCTARFPACAWLSPRPPALQRPRPAPPPVRPVADAASVIGAAPAAVRAEPHLAARSIGFLNPGDEVELDCQIVGDVVDGTRLWDRLTSGGYVSDAQLDTDPGSGVLCTDPA